MMMPQTFLCALLIAAAQGAKTSEASAKPYYVFKNHCDGRPKPGELVDGATAGYMPYPNNNTRRRGDRDLGKAGEVVEETGGGGGGYLFSKCKKKTGGALTSSKSKSSKSKTSKSKTSKSKSSKSTSSTSRESSGEVPTAPNGDPPSWPSAPTSPTAVYTPLPAPKPAPKPSTVETEVSSCDALFNGDVVETPTFSLSIFSYEAAVDEDASVEDVTKAIQKNLGLLVGKNLMDCDDRRSLLQQEEDQRLLEGLEVVGIDSGTEGPSTKSCSYFTGSNRIADTDCHVIKGGMTIYYVHGSASSSDVEKFLERTTSNALKRIRKTMNRKDPSPLVEGSEGEYSVDDLMGVRFIRGTTYNGEDIVGDNEEDGSSDGDYGLGANVVGIQDGGGESTAKSSKMTSVGGALLLAAGLVALLTLALMLVVRKRKRSSVEKYNTFDEDDANDLEDVYDTDMDAQSLKSSNKGAYVVGEEGSLYTSATHDTRVLHVSNETGNGNEDDQQVDVHHCTSAICPICNGKETVFVPAVDDNQGTEQTVEEYGMGYDPTASMRQSFDTASTPSYDNPAEIERPYIVDDTIDF